MVCDWDRPALPMQPLMRQTGIGSQGLVGEVRGAIAPITRHWCRNRIDDELQVALGFDRLFLGALAVLDVDNRSIPRDNIACFIARRRRSKQKPAMLSVGTPQPRFGIDRYSGGHILAPGVDKRFKVVGVNARFPPSAANLLGCRAGVLEPTLVELLNVTVRRAPPGYNRNRVQHQARLAFGFGQSGLALPHRALAALR